MTKRIYAIVSLVIITLVAAYTAFWFISKNHIEEKITNYLKSVEHKENITDVTFDLKTSCFPFLCVELSNLNFKTKKYFSISKEGFNFKALEEKPLIYKTKNIFNPAFDFNANQVSFDIHSTNLSTNQTVKFYTDFDDLKIYANKSSLELNANNFLLQVTTENAPLMALADIGSIEASYKAIKEDKKDNTTNIAFSYNLFKLNLFDQKTGKAIYSIPHSKLDAFIINISNQMVEDIKSIKKNTQQFTIDTINSLAKNKTALVIKDFKLTSQAMQVFGKGSIYIDKNYFLATNAFSGIKFLEKDSTAEKLLNAYQFSKTETGLYGIDVVTKNNVIKINNKISIPAPYFKPDKKTKVQ